MPPTRPILLAAALLICAILALPSRADIPVAARNSHGIQYRRDVISSEPWSVHVVSFARTNSGVQIHTSFGQSRRLALAPLSQHVTNLPPIYGRGVVGVNGDYFVREGPFAGDPEGLLITEGEFISAPNGKSAFWMDASGQPRLTNVTSRLAVTWPDGTRTPVGFNEERKSGKAVLYTAVSPALPTASGRDLILERGTNEHWLPLQPGVSYRARLQTIVDSGTRDRVTPGTLCLSVDNGLLSKLPPLLPGAAIEVSLETEPSLLGATLGIGGGPALLRNGRRTDFKSENVRHPRTGIGWNDTHFFLVQVDGRQRQLSVGMTLREFGDYFEKLGCTDALNLDGGGSSTIWCYGQVMNSPCDGVERGTGDALILTLPPSKDRD